MTWTSGADEPIGGRAAQGWDQTATRKEKVLVDARLVVHAQAGDLDAFVRLIGLHDRAMRALAYRLLGNRQRMDDVLQEAYLKAFRSLGDFKARSAFGSWLYRIVYNSCMDDLRRGRNGGRFVSLSEADDFADPMPDPGDTAAQRLDLAAALASLSPVMRATVLLVDAEGMDYEAAAQVLDIPVGTVRSRLSQARRRLRRALSEDSRGGDRR